MIKRKIAVFDFDGTITKKDSLLEFIKFSKGKFQFYLGFMLFSPLLIAMKLKLYPNWKVKQQVFSFFYKGDSINQFNNWALNFIPRLEEILRPEAIVALDSHKKKGNHIVIVSASIENWIKPWSEKVGINDLLATKIEINEEGIITGKFLSKNCYGPEKVVRLLEAYPDRINYILIAYGDSLGDKELLDLSDEPFYKKF